ncbi:unnamed protein product, partial [Adineta steineri]
NLIAEYRHLTVLDEQFLNQTKTYVPCLTELMVIYNDLRIITKNFTREETRRNCANIKRLVMSPSLVHSQNFYVYFLSLL